MGSRTTKRFFLLFLVLFVSLEIFFSPRLLTAGMAIIPLDRKEKIPEKNPDRRRFETWSLFLICNPTWLRLENSEKVQDLYHQFLAFGDAIGRSHAALWFGRGRAIGIKEAMPTIDSGRSALWCEKFGLLPSKAPYVFVTTTYPNLEAPLEDFDYYTLSFHQSDSCTISQTLAELTDQLLVTGLSQRKLANSQYWLDWKQTFTQFLTKISWKASVGFNTRFFRADLKGQGTGVPSSC